MSSTAVDDRDPRFNYKDNQWTAGGQSGEFDSTSHNTSTAGAQVIFGPFSGSSIAVYSTVGTSQPKVHFFVDDDVQNVDIPAQSNSGVKFQQQLYSASNLDPTTQHTLQINVEDAGPFTLDYVLIGNGQSGIALQQSSSVSSSIVSSAHATRTSGASSSSNTSPTTSVTQSVGGSVTSSSISSLSPTTSSSSSSTPSLLSTISSSSSVVPLAVGVSPTSSVLSSPLPISSDNTAVGSALSTSASSPPTAVSMGAASTSGPDATVIGSVTGSIALLAIVVVSVVLFLRRRRLAQPGRSVPNNKPSGWYDPPPKHRPSLHLSIPSSLSIPRTLQRPSLLPTHSNKSVPTSIKHSVSSSRPMPSFLAEDPNESPVFDIKQRPVSGSTMTTRVTVGTSIGQRVSVPDSVYHYPYLGTPVPVPVPPLPALPSKSSIPSPTDTGVSSATGSGSHLGFGLLGTNPAGTLDTSIFSGFSENGSATAGSGASALRPLPYTPTDAKRARADLEAGGHTAPTHSHRFLPTTPSEAETVVHQDGGVRLASNALGQPRRELPPPYQDYGI